MNAAMQVEPEAAAAESMWLELCFEGQSHTFELKADESRAVAVGSLRGADLRIDRPGVAPVQFHIERESDAMWIVPAYNSRDLRVDSACITGPQRIDGCAIIEFAGVRLYASGLDADWVMTKDTSLVTVQRTVVIEPYSEVPLASTKEGDNSPPTLRTGENAVKTRTVTSRVRTLGDLSTHDTIEMAPFWMTQTESESPTKSDSNSISSAQQPTGSDARTQSTTVFDVQYIRPQQPKAQCWLARLGMLSGRRPVAVWLAGTASIFVLSASIGLATKHFHRAAKPQVGHLPRAVMTTAPWQPSGVAGGDIVPMVPKDDPQPIVIAPAVPSRPSSFTKKGQLHDPALVAAVGHLIAGRYSDAQKAYVTLAAQSPGDATLAALVRLLSKKMEPRCAGTAPKANASCPEVKP